MRLLIEEYRPVRTGEWTETDVANSYLFQLYAIIPMYSRIFLSLQCG